MRLIKAGRLRVCGVFACFWLLGGCHDSGKDLEHVHAYVANKNSLASYSIDSSTGRLAGQVGTSITFPQVTFENGGITGLIADPSGRFLYVLGYNTLYGFVIDPDSGALTGMPGSPFDLGFFPRGITFDASGNWLYVTSISSDIPPITGAISVFSLSGSGVPLLHAIYPMPSEFNAVAIAGNYLYDFDSDAQSISVFAIGSNGELALISGTKVNPVTLGILANPSGAELYTTAFATSGSAPDLEMVSAFTISNSTGMLAPAPVNPQPVLTVNGASIDPSGRFLFTYGSSSVSSYDIDAATGALELVAGSPFATGSEPSAISFDPSGEYVYVLNFGSADVSEFKFTGAGALAPLNGSPVPVISKPIALVVVRD